MGAIVDGIFGWLGAKEQTKAADKQIAASQDATRQTLALQERIFNQIWNGTAVQRQAGDAATRQIMAMMGLGGNGAQRSQTGMGAQGAPAQNPYGPQVNPGPGGGQAPSLNGGTKGQPLGPIFMRPQGFDQPNVLTDDGFRPGDLDPGQYGGGGSLTSGQGGGTQFPTGDYGGPQINPGQPGNALDTDPTAWLRNTPGYQFNFDEGMRALNTGLASQGRLMSGDAAREAQRYGQNYGDRIYNTERNALFNLAGMGQVSQGQAGAAGQSYAANSGNALMNNAANLGSSYQNRGNAMSGFYGTVSGGIQDFGRDAGWRGF